MFKLNCVYSVFATCLLFIFINSKQVAKTEYTQFNFISIKQHRTLSSNIKLFIYQCLIFTYCVFPVNFSRKAASCSSLARGPEIDLSAKSESSETTSNSDRLDGVNFSI